MGAHANLYLLFDTDSIIIFSEGMRSRFHLEVEKRRDKKTPQNFSNLESCFMFSVTSLAIVYRC